ncbi:interferon-induced GTP-binding protein Mx1-like [Hemiscyllium ocellatum]|uniref:interferon-induced GTP-binding protein Mx1-like n=1 Tax=Hemiscyllium ocellatum TaxID=170820 RepID=UPI002966C18F|nr:interferon-induced GTP-binding protein Mx1-like [Hemiscyllium ocellatum]
MQTEDSATSLPLPGHELQSINKKMEMMFYNSYEEKIRPCIDLIDSLRRLGVDKDLALPAIAVIGDQSSGKSSVLEALSGVSLPRGSGIVTRCPLELKLKKAKEDNVWKGKLTNEYFQVELTDPSEVEKQIQTAQNIMAGEGLGISQELISLQIESSNVPDLTLIDLPGIARVAIGNQPADIGDQIKRLIKSFIRRQETINLVVVPCNVDIATTEALKMAKEVDPSGERTLGILTKPDLVDKGTESNVVDIVQNLVVELKKGYMIVKCRGQQEINDQLSLSEAIEKERRFFEDHEDYRPLLDDKKATIPCLAERLTTELVAHIIQSLPELSKDIEEKLSATTKELEQYGEGVPDTVHEKTTFLIQKLNDFGQNLRSLSSGEEPDDCISEERCYTKVRNEFETWKHQLDKVKHQFYEVMCDKVMEYEKAYRGRELPGFINYKTFESIVKQQIVKLQQPAIQTLKKVTEIVREAFTDVAFYNFKGLPNLMRAAKIRIEDLKKQQESLAETQLQIQFKIENVVYSQDSIYGQKLTKAKSKSEEGSHRDDKRSSTKNCDLINPSLSNNGATIHEMTTHLKIYYTIATERLANQVPLIISYYILQEFAAKLQIEMLQLIQKDQIDEYLHEETDVADKRKTLRSRQQRLAQAHDHLSKFY